MKRTELLDLLNTVEPALSNKNVLPVLSTFWFTGERLMAYNEHIGISVPCATEFSGCVASNLAGLLRASVAEEVKLSVSNDNLNVKAGRSNFKLARMDYDSDLFTMPKMKSKKPFPVDGLAFVDAIEAALPAISPDANIADHKGITLIHDDGLLYVISCNGQIIIASWMEVDGDLPFDHCVLSGPFCKELVRLCRDKKEIRLDITDRYALCQADDALLFGRLIEIDHPIDYLDRLDRYAPDDVIKKAVKVPDPDFGLIVERALIVATGSSDDIRTDVVAEKGVVTFTTVNAENKIDDRLDLKGQSNVSVKIAPKWLKDGVGKYSKMIITDGAFILADKERLYLVATISR